MRYVIPGGDTRIASVKNAVRFLSDKIDDEDKIVISDAARPCITTREIKEMFVSLDTHIASTSGLECYETILKLENDKISQIIKRDGLIRQTSPEGYKFRALKWLYIKADADIINSYKNIGIDQLFASGADIGIVYSNHLNFKITTNDDLNLFETVVKNGFSSFLDGKNGAQK